MKKKPVLFWGLLGVLGVLALLLLQMFIGGFVYRLVEQARPTLSATETLFAEAAIRASDLPFGWRQGRVTIISEPNAEGQLYTFYGTANRTETWINVSERLLLYQDAVAAQTGYQEQHDLCIPPTATRWQEIPELAFAHQADALHVECLPSSINGASSHACCAIARYDNLVIVLLGSVFEERWLSMSEFRAVLEAMDRRAAAALDKP